MSEDTRAFDLTGPLPRDTTCVLEASAGTGKTFHIAGLAVRYVAEGVCTLPQLLVVTFTRAATAELRDRVRRRLVAAAGHLARVEAALQAGQEAEPTEDRLLAHLADVDPGELAARRLRLETALMSFDAATISTIHGFCQHMLAGVGIAGDVDRDAELVDDHGELVDQVVDDLMLARFHADEPAITRGALAAIARTVVATHDAALVPGPDDDVADDARLRGELAVAVRAEIDRRRRQRRVLSYDDLLTRLAASLTDDVGGETARDVLRARYRVVLVDEFQDTDPVQWRILDAAFGGGAATLVLIGDPKQAIYAFRGADVYAYLDAARTAPQHATLGENWRSDAPLLAAYDRLFAGATFGSPHIRYEPVRAAPPHGDTRLRGLDDPAPLQLRVVRRDTDGLVLGRGKVVAASARAHLVGQVLAEARALLAGDTVIRPDNQPERPLAPADIAVLVRTNAEAAQVQQAMLGAGVPAIINGVGSVFATPAAVTWQRLLEALERPSDPRRARAMAISEIIGLDCRQVVEAGDDVWDAVHERLHRWSSVLRDHGVASLLHTIEVQQRLPARVLRRPGGERLLTDLAHIGELAHAAQVADGLGVTALTGWLRDRRREAEDDPPDEQARRLESDDDAVQILTVHRAKGLQFPVVLCPFLWSPGQGGGNVPVFHDRDTGVRTVDVAGGGEEHAHHKQIAERERQGEMLRVLYVALTRARHRTVVWWAPVKNADAGPLTRLLFCRDDRDRVRDCTEARLPADDVAVTRLARMTGDGLIAVRPTGGAPPPPAPVREAAAAATLRAATCERPLDHSWRRTSYSALTAAAHEEIVASEPEEHGTDDEELAAVVTHGSSGAGQPLPLAPMPGGADVGTVIHSVLERAELSAPDVRSEVARAVDESWVQRRVDIGDHAVVVDGLVAAVTTPLGAQAGGADLASFGPRDRLVEVDFELPLGAARVARIGALLDTHLPDHDPLSGYGQHLREPGFQVEVGGYLAGSIDLVLRVHGEDGTPRFVVVDHKTNRLGVAATTADYAPAALTAAMIAGHYPLQALLYQVALHRYLRWRQPGYDPHRHLGGALYLFLRGMTGPGAPQVDGLASGVFAWQPPPALVTATSDLLDARPAGGT